MLIPIRNYSSNLTFTNTESIVFHAPDETLRNDDASHSSATFSITLVDVKFNRVNWADTVREFHRYYQCDTTKYLLHHGPGVCLDDDEHPLQELRVNPRHGG